MTEMVFPKAGKEIKAAIQRRQEQLRQRLVRRNETLEGFMEDRTKLRSYLLRSAQPEYVSHGRSPFVLVSEAEISIEEKQEVQRLCARIFEIEQELHRLSLISAHLRDDQVVELSFDDLVAYGFDANLSAE